MTETEDDEKLTTTSRGEIGWRFEADGAGEHIQFCLATSIRISFSSISRIDLSLGRYGLLPLALADHIFQGFAFLVIGQVDEVYCARSTVRRFASLGHGWHVFGLL